MKNVNITDFGARADSEELQNTAIQTAIDSLGEEGGIVRIPRGRFVISGIQLRSNVTLHLESGAWLVGSETIEDYPVFDLPEGIKTHTNVDFYPSFFADLPSLASYRRAMITAVGCENIAVVGEPGSHIDGRDSADPHGEEGFRGAHIMFLSNVKNLHLEGYTTHNSGNFAHQIDTCENITVRGITCLGGHDGVDLHFSENLLIEDCTFHTGDDCIAGVNIRNLTVRRCDFNTSCQAFRIGGRDILIESCHMWGPGIYPHRMSIVPNRGTESVRDRSLDLPREAGQHSFWCPFMHFASALFPSDEPYGNIVFRDCKIENPNRLMVCRDGVDMFATGTPLSDVTFENVTVSGVKSVSDVHTSGAPVKVALKNVTASFAEGSGCDALFTPSDALELV